VLLFVGAWHGDDELRGRARSALLDVTALFPDLGLADVTETGWQGTSWLACVDSGGPVQSLMSSERSCLIEGVAVADDAVMAPGGLAEAFDARSLDGQFVVLDATPERLRVVTDPTGFWPVYWARDGEAWLVSNRVEILARTLRHDSLDLEGAAATLALGWPIGERTLCRGVTTVPAGIDLTWSVGTSEPMQRRHGPWLNEQPSFEEDAELGDRLVNTLAAVGRWAGRLQAPITAGLDSRVIVALLMAGGVDATYFTVGPGWDADAGVEIARKLGLEHRLLTFGRDDVVGAWPDLVERLVTQNDGMVSLWQAPDLLTPTGAPLQLWGVGGEVSRGSSTGLRSLISLRPRKQIEHIVPTADSTPLLTADGAAVAKRLLIERLGEIVELPYRRRDLREALYVHERYRLYGANTRKTTPAVQFTPFATRRFYEAAFAVDPALRPSSPLHFRLLRELSPDLHRYPVDEGGWRVQVPYVNLLQKRWRERRGKAPRELPHQFTWFDGVHRDVLSRCLDRSSSPLWDIVDRAPIERLAISEPDPVELSRMTKNLLSLCTLFEYEACRQAAG